MIWTDLVRRRNDTSLKLDDILLLLVFVYNSIDVRDAFPQEEEERLRSVLGARRRLRNTSTALWCCTRRGTVSRVSCSLVA